MIYQVTLTHPVIILAITAVYAGVLWAIVLTIRDKDLTPTEKVVWTVIVAAVPFLGLAVWLIVRLLNRLRSPGSPA